MNLFELCEKIVNFIQSYVKNKYKTRYSISTFLESHEVYKYKNILLKWMIQGKENDLWAVWLKKLKIVLRK